MHISNWSMTRIDIRRSFGQQGCHLPNYSDAAVSQFAARSLTFRFMALGDAADPRL